MQPLPRVIATIYLVAVALNYPWELAQAVLFTGESHQGNVFLHCFVASLGDGVILLVLFGIGWATAGTPHWFRHPRAADYIALIVSGAALATAVEWIAVHMLQRWTYADAMPRLPLLDVGLAPLLQMILLPPLIFWIAAKFAKADPATA